MKTIKISDAVDTFVMKGKTYIADAHTCSQQPSELAAFVGIVSQMFYDHEGNFADGDGEQEQTVRDLFNKMREIVGFVVPSTT